MRPAELHRRMAAACPGALLQEVLTPRARAVVDVGRLVSVLRHGKEDPELALDHLQDLFGIDMLGLQDPPMIRVVYLLESLQHRHRAVLEVHLPRDGSVVLPSVAHLWPGAAWHERELMDLLGVQVDLDIPAPRLLSSIDSVGHLLRKDHPAPREG